MTAEDELQPERIYVEAGGLAWAFAGAWRCAAMAGFLDLFLRGRPSDLGALLLNQDWRTSAYLIGDALLLGLVAFVAVLLLGEEVAASRVQQTLRSLIGHAILGMQGAANVLFVSICLWKILQLLLSGGTEAISSFELDITRTSGILGSLLVPGLLLVGLILRLYFAASRPLDERDEFIRIAIQQAGWRAALAGVFLGAAALISAFSLSTLVFWLRPSIIVGSLDPIGIFICLLMATVKAAGAGCLAASSGSWITTRLVPSHRWNEAMKVSHRGWVIGGLLSLGIGFLHAFYFAYINPPAPTYTFIGAFTFSFTDRICFWITNYFFSGALFLGALVGAASVIWRIRRRLLLDTEIS